MKTTISSKEKYNIIYKMVNELNENERCYLIGDIIADIEISTNIEIETPSLIKKQAEHVVFDKKD